jgi:hypothetical protein
MTEIKYSGSLLKSADLCLLVPLIGPEPLVNQDLLRLWPLKICLKLQESWFSNFLKSPQRPKHEQTPSEIFRTVLYVSLSISILYLYKK